MTNRIEINPIILNSLEVDYDTIKNSVIIPFRTGIRFNEDVKKTYNKLIENNSQLLDSVFTLVLCIEAKQGHNMYDFDKHYNYYIAAIVDINGESTLIRNDITDTITEHEAMYIQNILWGHRDIVPILQKQAEIRLNDFDNKDVFILHSHCLIDERYQGTWKSTKHKGCILITILNYNNLNPIVHIDDERYININKM